MGKWQDAPDGDARMESLRARLARAETDRATLQITCDQLKQMREQVCDLIDAHGGDWWTDQLRVIVGHREGRDDG